MDNQSSSCNSISQDPEVRKGPWTMEEDLILINYIANHGEGAWNSLAKSAGLKRNGKSCRLRWLNYLRPDIRRGNITAEEQLLIMELHAKWGNRWSKIAKHLPGRTDNEIKNYWRTRIQKQLKHAENMTYPIHEAHITSYIMDDQMEHLSSCGPAVHAVDQSLYSPTTSFHGNNIDNHNNNSTGSAFYQAPFPSDDQSTDNMWTMEDLWFGP